MILVYWWRYLTDEYFRECIKTTKPLAKDIFLTKECREYHKLRLKTARKRPYDVFIRWEKWHW